MSKRPFGRSPGAPREKAGKSTRRSARAATDPAPLDPGHGDEIDVEIRRSARRRRTVSAYRDGDRVVVLVPARLSRAEEREWVQTMLERLAAQERRRRPSDDRLQARAETLSDRHLDGRAVPESVRWVHNQASRWGSCTPSDRTIRLSSRLQGMPGWVIDYVLLHELAHLLEPGHTARFWTLVGRYSRADRARGYLEGVAAAAQLPLSDLADTEPPDTGPPDTGPPDTRDRASRARASQGHDATADHDVQQVLFGTQPVRRRRLQR